MFSHTRIVPILSALTASILLVLVSSGVAAAAVTAGPDNAPANLPNTVNCFDYYHFGSIQANLNTSVVSAVSGTTVTFNGTLSNNNAYPIVDGALYVKVFKMRSVDDSNGPDVVDQFVAKDGISIPANGSVSISFDWNVPSYAKSGDYQIATFFTVSKKFSLLGLYFTDDVVGNTVPFSVTGEQSTGVSFDKTSAKVNDKQYRFAAIPPVVGAKEPVTVSAAIVNSTDAKQTVALTWTAARWDASLKENVLENKSAAVDVPAHGSAPVSIDVGDLSYPVYDVLGTLKWNDTSSIIGVRFVRSGVDVPRINFSGVTAFPLRSGHPASFFSCVHDTGAGSVPNARVDLTLTDLSGNSIQSYSYKGVIPSAMTGIADQFTPSRSYDSFILDTKLYSGNALIDESKETYSCKDIAPTLCIPTTNSPLNTAIAVVAVLVLFVVLLWMRKKLHQGPLFINR